MTGGIDEHEVADLLRLCVFAMERARVSMMAFVDHRYIRRDHDRLREVEQMVTSMLGRLSPEEPLTDERMSALGDVVGAVLRKRFGEGSAEEVDLAFRNAFPPPGDT